MSTTSKHNERIARMTFASVYPHYLAKIEKKGRTEAELHQVIEWLTGFDTHQLQQLIDDKATFETFLGKHSSIHTRTSSPVLSAAIGLRTLQPP